MRALSLVCVLCIFPALFCFRLEFEEYVFDQSESDVVLHSQTDDTDELEPYFNGIEFDEEANEMSPGKCMCCMHGCECKTVDPRSDIPIRVSLMLSDADEDRLPRLSAVMSVGPVTYIDRDIPFKNPKEICGEKIGKTYCFKVYATIEGMNGRRKIEGSVKMTKPQKIFIGNFKMPE